MKSKNFSLADGRNVSIEVGEVMTNMVVVTIDDELVPANLFVDTYQCVVSEDGVLAQNIFFHSKDEVSEEIDDYGLDFDDVSLIAANIVAMGDFMIAAEMMEIFVPEVA